MPSRSQPRITPFIKDAAWLEWSDATRARALDPEHPAFRPFRELGLRVLGEDLLKDRFFAGTPCSATHLVWIVIRGSVSVDFGQGPVVLEKGRLALCPAIRPHWVRLVSKSARGLWFHLHRVPRWHHLSGAGPAVRIARHAGEMEWLLDHCLTECGSAEFGAGHNALHYAEILAVMLERELAVFGPRPKEQPLVSRLESLWAEIMGNPGGRWTVSTIADTVGASTRELHRVCADRYGIGPMGVVTRMRMDRAMELLLTTDRKIADISHEVGYRAAHAFSETFLSHVGKRPGAFRGSASGSSGKNTPG